jgi:hypothetical protein
MPTAVAPSASALKMAVPRRIPPPTNTGMRPLTAATTSGRQSMLARNVPGDDSLDDQPALDLRA